MLRRIVLAFLVLGALGVAGCTSGNNVTPDATATMSRSERVAEALVQFGGYPRDKITVNNDGSVAVLYKSCDIAFLGNEKQAAPPSSNDINGIVVTNTNTEYALWWIVSIEGHRRADLDAEMQTYVSAPDHILTNVGWAYLQARISGALQRRTLTCN